MTPQDVSTKRFSSRAFKRGYDLQEVDAFLDDVVDELERLNAKIRDLEARLAADGAQERPQA